MPGIRNNSQTCHSPSPDRLIGLQPENLERTRTLMNAHVRDDLVTDFEHLIQSVEVPDPGNRLEEFAKDG